MKYYEIVTGIKKSLIADFLKTDWESFRDFLSFLDKVLHDLAQNVNVQKEIFDGRSIEEGKNIIIFGAGDGGKRLLKKYRENKIEVSYFCDNDRNKQHILIEGVQVIAPEEINQVPNNHVIVASLYWQEIGRQLETLNIPHVIADVHLQLLPDSIENLTSLKGRVNFFIKHLNSFYQTYLLLSDERSKFVYLNILKANLVVFLHLDRDIQSKVYEGNQYWALPEFQNIKDEVYVDAGACTGDTIEKFLYNTGGTFNKIYAFEASSQYFQRLKWYSTELINMFGFEKNSIQCISEGVGNEEGVLTFYCDTSSGCDTFARDLSAGKLTWKQTEQVKICKLDNYLKGVPVTFIKADIEGSELDMLKGATELIKSYQPRLAICLYHKLEDLFETPLYIKSIVPEYKMAVRHHSDAQAETVLYCWISSN